jgi:hypothetical protein
MNTTHSDHGPRRISPVRALGQNCQTKRRSLSRSVVTGALSGAVGTAAMDALLYVRYRRSGGTQGPLAWEFSAGVETWEGVSAPGLVGKRLLEALLGRKAPDRWARSVQNTMHWATGMGWSGQFGAVASLVELPAWTEGLIFGPTVWLSSQDACQRLKCSFGIRRYYGNFLRRGRKAFVPRGLKVAPLSEQYRRHRLKRCRGD